MKILIVTGIYPPEIGGPAQYAKNLKETFTKMGHSVEVKTYGIEGKLPTGLRHLYFFAKIFFAVPSADAVLVLDTFSVGLPAIMACKMFGQRAVIRTGGDFLWEHYVERTKKRILLKDFYKAEAPHFSLKEKMIFRLTKWVLKNASKVIFSTKWQRDIFARAYILDTEHTGIIENYYGPKESDEKYTSKVFLASSRKLFLKNTSLLNKIFDSDEVKASGATLFKEATTFENLIKKMKTSYAVIAVAFSDISPNLILDAIRHNKPFVCTKEIGLHDRIGDVGIFVDPLNEGDIKEAVLRLLSDEEYNKVKEKIRNFNFVHSWNDIAREFIEAFNSIK